MSKLCVKCGYIRQPVDTAPDYECPKCGVIYEKAESAIREVKNLKSQSSMQLRKNDSTNNSEAEHKKGAIVSKAVFRVIFICAVILVAATLVVALKLLPRERSVGPQVLVQSSNAWCGVPMKDGTRASRECDLDNLCKDWIFFRRKIVEYESAGDAAKANDARLSFQKTNVWLGAYEEKDVAACILENEKQKNNIEASSDKIGELLKDYEIAKNQGTPKNICDYAGKIVREYTKSFDTKNSRLWREKEQADCSAYKRRTPSESQLNQERACFEMAERDPNSDERKCMIDAGYTMDEDVFRMCLRSSTSTKTAECSRISWIPEN